MTKTKIKSEKTKALIAKSKSKGLTPKEKNLDSLNKAAIVEKITAKREMKYIYPNDVVDPLARKAFRQKVRNTYDSFIKRLKNLKDEKAKSSLNKEFSAFKKATLVVA